MTAPATTTSSCRRTARQVAFDSDRDGERGVYVADANGRGVRRVSGDGYAAVPTWAPDGGRLAFLRAEPGRPGVWNLWLLDRDTGRQTRLTSFQRGQVWGGAWFGDGRRIAYSHEDRLRSTTWRRARCASSRRRCSGGSSAPRPCRPTAAGSCSRCSATAPGCSTSSAASCSACCRIRRRKSSHGRPMDGGSPTTASAAAAGTCGRWRRRSAAPPSRDAPGAPAPPRRRAASARAPRRAAPRSGTAGLEHLAVGVDPNRPIEASSSAWVRK